MGNKKGVQVKKHALLNVKHLKVLHLVTHFVGISMNVSYGTA